MSVQLTSGPSRRGQTRQRFRRGVPRNAGHDASQRIAMCMTHHNNRAFTSVLCDQTMSSASRTEWTFSANPRPAERNGAVLTMHPMHRKSRRSAMQRAALVD